MICMQQLYQHFIHSVEREECSSCACALTNRTIIIIIYCVACCRWYIIYVQNYLTAKPILGQLTIHAFFLLLILLNFLLHMYIRVQNSSASISFIVLTYFLLCINIGMSVMIYIVKPYYFPYFFSPSHSDERLITNLMWTCEWGERGKSGQMTQKTSIFFTSYLMHTQP